MKNNNTEKLNQGTLYIVGTPIGNLGDLSLRAAKTLESVDFIAAEDTRHTLKLLNHLQIKKPMISYFEHNRTERGEIIINRIENGESCALCSDAGMPAISDPGEELVREAYAHGITVVPIPGPTAFVSALCASGQATSRFVFEGFLPQNRRTRKEHLAQLENEERTIIFYEAPHKLPQTLQDLAAFFGTERKISLCRELTKLHEEIFSTTLGQAVERYENEKPRGEFVLVMAGCEKASTTTQMSLEEAAVFAQQLIETENLSPSLAAKKAARHSGLAKSDIYRQISIKKEVGQK